MQRFNTSKDKILQRHCAFTTETIGYSNVHALKKTVRDFMRNFKDFSCYKYVIQCYPPVSLCVKVSTWRTFETLKNIFFTNPSLSALVVLTFFLRLSKAVSLEILFSSNRYCSYTIYGLSLRISHSNKILTVAICIFFLNFATVTETDTIMLFFI